MSEIKEQKWLCGCHVVDGVLAQQCTQQRPQGEVTAAQHAASRPYSAKCFRLAPPVIHVPVPEGDKNIEVAALGTPLPNEKAITGQEFIGVAVSPVAADEPLATE